MEFADQWLWLIFVAIGLFFVILELVIGIETGLDLVFIGSVLVIGGLVTCPFDSWLLTATVTIVICIAYIVVGLLAWLMVIPLSWLLKKDPHEIGALPDGIISPLKDAKFEEIGIQPTHFSLIQVLKTRNIWYICIISIHSYSIWPV